MSGKAGSRHGLQAYWRSLSSSWQNSVYNIKVPKAKTSEHSSKWLFKMQVNLQLTNDKLPPAYRGNEAQPG